MKHEEMQQRVLETSEYLVSNQSTIRETAKHFHYSKSAAYFDVTYRLPKMFPHKKELHQNVLMVLSTNKEARAYRGGEATRIKYLNLKKTK